MKHPLVKDYEYKEERDQKNGVGIIDRVKRGCRFQRNSKEILTCDECRCGDDDGKIANNFFSVDLAAYFAEEAFDRLADSSEDLFEFLFLCVWRGFLFCKFNILFLLFSRYLQNEE